MAEKGLTGIREDARGFVGSKPAPKFDTTTKGRSRIRFELACGQNDAEAGVFPTWRHCVTYGVIAEAIKDLHVGQLVRVSGWVKTEQVVDEYFKPVRDDKDIILKKEYLILYKAEIMAYEKKPELQPLLIG